MRVQVYLESGAVHALAARVECALGRPLSAALELGSAEPLDPEALVGTAVRIEALGAEGSLAVYHGIVARITAAATTDDAAERRYSVDVRSAIEIARLRRDARIFRKKTAKAIVKEVLAGIGIDGDAFVDEVGEAPPEREHVSQWSETDAVFLRRVCEEDGLYFRFDPKDGCDAFVLCDRSSAAPAVLEGPLRFVDATGQLPDEPVAYHPRLSRRRRAGKVAVRDYDPQHPKAKLEGKAEGGVDAEKKVEVYGAPGRFTSEGDAAREARLRLESLRADASVLDLETTALALRPGVSFEADAQLIVGPAPSGKWFVVETTLDWRAGAHRGELAVRAIPLDVPYRLPRVTPRPRIPGILSGIVTGASGEEIHTDAAGSVRVGFHWDRSGPKDEKASLPVRVMQANLPGSMLIPRVGWEVLVGFEDGDPDRPYVLGRSFNGQQLPPFSLPANKTITAIGSASSPGGGKTNVIHMDDGAGRQHMVWNAGFGKTTHVGTDMLNQTVGFDVSEIKGNQSWQIGGNDTVSVQSAWTVSVGSQSGTVSGNQTLTLNATGGTEVDSETVLVGGALIEQVGNPITGLGEFAKAAIIAGAGEIPVVGPFLGKGLSWGNALYQGYKTGGMNGLANAAGQTIAGEIAGQIPGGDAIVAAADGAGLTPWSEKAQQRAAAQQAGGGGGGPGAEGGGAAAAAPGHRKLLVDGVVTEVIGAIHGIQTPGSLKWTTLGASTFDIGGSHSTAAVKISRLTMCASSDTAAATSITARSNIGRNVKAAHTLKAGGAVKLDAGGEVGIKAKGALTLKSSGAASFEGGTVVFEVGGASVSVHGGGVTLAAPEITINGKNKQSGKETSG